MIEKIKKIELRIFDVRVRLKEGDFIAIHGDANTGKSPILRDFSREYPEETCFIIRDDVPHIQHRVNVLKAIVKPSEIYLLDEPTGHSLDREDRMKILALIKELHDQGKTIIMATHDQAAIELATRIIEIMEDKTFIDHGPGLHHML
jgi:ABC-type lipoprotein export system ATPase subunit